MFKSRDKEFFQRQVLVVDKKCRASISIETNIRRGMEDFRDFRSIVADVTFAS